MPLDDYIMKNKLLYKTINNIDLLVDSTKCIPTLLKQLMNVATFPYKTWLTKNFTYYILRRNLKNTSKTE